MNTRSTGPLLDDLSGVHHADPIGELAHDAEIVGDEQHRHAEPLLDVLEQFQDLRLHRDVERGGRLVGDQQIGLVRQGHGDHHALALAAGELMRIARQAPGGIGNADLAKRSRTAVQPNVPIDAAKFAKPAPAPPPKVAAQ